MGLNDEAEKLRQAREWLDAGSPQDERARAAWEHVTHTALHGPRELRREAWNIIDTHREFIVWRGVT
jgi:hypothetical protein